MDDDARPLLSIATEELRPSATILGEWQSGRGTGRRGRGIEGRPRETEGEEGKGGGGGKVAKKGEVCEGRGQ